MKKLFFATMVAFVIACGDGTKNNGDADKNTDSTETNAEVSAQNTSEGADYGDIIEVSNEAEFFEHIGSRRTLKLNSGDYDLGNYLLMNDVSEKVTDKVSYSGGPSEGWNISIHDVENLKILGVGNSVIKTGDGFDQNLHFENCKNILLENFEIHGSDNKFATGTAISAKNTKGFTVSNLVVSGWMWTGFRGEKVSGVSFDLVHIEKCTRSIVELNDFGSAMFSNSYFLSSSGFRLIDIKKGDALFTDCQFNDNTTEDGSEYPAGVSANSLFAAEDGKITVQKGMMEYNFVDFLSSGNVELNNVTDEGNNEYRIGKFVGAQ